MLSDTIGSARTEALRRIVLGIPWVIISLGLITPVILTLTLVRTLIAMGVSLLVGREIMRNSDQLSMWLYDLYYWNFHNLRWAITGGASAPMWLPRFTTLER